MKRLLAWIVVVLLVVAGLVLVLRPGAQPQEPVHADTPSTPPVETTSAAQLANAPAKATLSASQETARELAHVETQPPPPAVAADTPAVLAVLVVAKEDAAPLAKIRLRARDLDAPKPEPGQAATGKNVRVSERGSLDDDVVTRETGRAEIDLPPGHVIELYARSEDGSTGEAFAKVQPLTPGERRELRVELPTRDDATFHVRVVDAETRAPVAGAALTNGKTELARADADGRCAVPWPTWRPRALGVSATGYAQREVVPNETCASAEHALLVELERPASVVVTLKGVPDTGERPVLVATTERWRLRPADSLVVGGAKISGGELVTWNAEFDASSRAELADLPPGVDLTLSARRGKTRVFEPKQEPLVLAPRERRALEWTYDAGCSLTVRAVDDTGRPVPNVMLWLLADTGKLGELADFTNERDARRVATDEQGNAAFGSVSRGAWGVCPAARPVRSGRFDENALAPRIERFTVAADETERTVELAVARALFIHGNVKDPEGNPPKLTLVHGISAQRKWLQTQVGKDGAFVLGPLVPGTYQLRASNRRDYVDSPEVEAEAGATGVVLQLRAAGRLRGRVVDARTGDGAAAELFYSESSVPSGGAGMTGSKPDGAFELGALAAGTYALTARTADGRVGSVRGVRVEVGVEAPEQRVAVSPGARLRVRWDAREGTAAVNVEHDGVRVLSDGVSAGASVSLVTPAGALRVLVSKSKNTPPLVQEVVLVAGEERELVFRDD